MKGILRILTLDYQIKTKKERENALIQYQREYEKRRKGKEEDEIING